MGTWKTDRTRSFWRDICENSNLANVMDTEQPVPPLRYEECSTFEPINMFSFIAVILSRLSGQSLALARSGNSLISERNNFQLKRFEFWEFQLNLVKKEVV